MATKPKLPLAKFRELTAMQSESARAMKALDAAAMWKTMDVFANQAGRIGYGTSNLLEGTSYPLTRLTTSGYILFTSLYRSHWIIRKIVDGFAEDMTKNWLTLDTQASPAQLTRFKNTVDSTATIARLQDTIRWARLYGGAGAVMVIKGQENLEKPLKVDDVELGAYQGLLVFDRWSGIYPSGQICTDTSDPLMFGLPEYYEITTTTAERMKVHCSRLLRFAGPPLPVWEWMAEQRWGISEIEIVFEELKKRDNASYNIASLIFRANIFALKQKDLAQMLSGVGGSPQAARNFYAVLSAQSQLMSNQGLMVLPEDGGLETHQYGFAGIAEVYEQFKEDICGATGYPYSKLFGRSPGGLSKTNETDEQQYYDLVAQKQKRELDPALRQLLPVILMSTWGKVPKDLTWNYRPVRTLSNVEQSDLAAKVTDNVEKLVNAGIFGRQTALKEVKEQAPLTGFGTNITDQDIEEADNQVVSPMEQLVAPALSAPEPGAETQDADTRISAKEAEYMELLGAAKDADCLEVRVPGGVSSKLGCCDKYKPGTKSVEEFRCGVCKYVQLKAADAALEAENWDFQGLKINIENLRGSTRHGKTHHTTMTAPYGYIKGTEGADGDEVDCFVGAVLNAPYAYVVHTRDPRTGDYDEDKVVLGCESAKEAQQLFLDNYSSPEFFESMERLTITDLKAKLSTLRGRRLVA